MYPLYTNAETHNVTITAKIQRKTGGIFRKQTRSVFCARRKYVTKYGTMMPHPGAKGKENPTQS